ncbi:MAG: hypothetical protein Kow0065_12350 [Methylomicrobium sp.]
MLAMLLNASIANADWVLNSKQSKFNFMTTKNASVTEKHVFEKITGSISSGAIATLKIDLASVETGVPIRNERMQELLFEVGRFQEAVVTLKPNRTQLDALKAGEFFDQPVSANLNLHGMENSVDANLRIVKLADGGLLVTTIAPIVFNPELFGMKNGIEKLRNIANLQSITSLVPVTFSLVFDSK